MSERNSNQSGPHAPPTSERLLTIDELTTPPSYDEVVLPGLVMNPYVKEQALPDDGLVFVGMNSAAYMKVPENRVGQIYTMGLAGCTGIAGVATIENGSLAGISHYDALVDTLQRHNGIGKSERFMNRFINVARACGAHAITLTVVLAELHRNDPLYGNRGPNYDDWHFVDQLESFVEEAEGDVTVSLVSYEDLGGHTLVANVDRTAQISIDFE